MLLVKSQQNNSLLDLEQHRLLELTLYEQEASSRGFQWIAGIDEAGRGPLAGPVVAAACIIPKGLFFPGIDDSKKLSAKKRQALYLSLTTNPHIHFALGIISSQDVDRVNIYQATILAMLEAVNSLKQIPDYLLVDGLNLPHPTIPCNKIIKGDSLSQSIAAASILAKVTRDKMMEEYDSLWPLYGFRQHKGYGTSNHIEAINLYGPTPIHRLSFAPLKLRHGGSK